MSISKDALTSSNAGQFPEKAGETTNLKRCADLLSNATIMIAAFTNASSAGLCSVTIATNADTIGRPDANLLAS
jgi:phosphate-selective porin